MTGDGFYMFGTPRRRYGRRAHHSAPFMTVVYQNRSYTHRHAERDERVPRRLRRESAVIAGGYFDPPIDFAKEAEAPAPTART